MMRRLTITLLAVASASALACGGESSPGSEEAEANSPEEVTLGYLSALAAGDGDAACSYLTDEVQRQVVERWPAAESCQMALSKVGDALPDGAAKVLRETKVSEPHVVGPTARVELSGDDRYEAPGGTDPVRLRKTSEGWKIAALPLKGTAAGEASEQRTCVAGGLDQFDNGTVNRFWQREGRADFHEYMRRTCRLVVSKDITDRSKVEAAAREVLAEMIREGTVRSPG
jgi:hypothetical protein